MKTLIPSEADLLNNAEPWTQVELLGSRLLEEANFGLYVFKVTIPAGTAGVITQVPLPNLSSFVPVGLGAGAGPRPDALFDFEVVDVVVRTETAVASSTLQAKAGSNAITDAIVSAVQWAQTRCAQIVATYSKFLPLSNPNAYAAAPLNLVDASGATAPARTVWVYVKKL